MGLQLSSNRFDFLGAASSERVSSHSHQHHRSVSPALGPRIRGVPHPSQRTAAAGSASTVNEPGSNSGRHHRRDDGSSVPPAVVLDRLIAEIENNGSVISPDDPRIFRILSMYRTSTAESVETSGRMRPASVMGTESAPISRDNRSRRTRGRQSSSTTVTAADNENLEEHLSAVRRQVLLSLAATSSSYRRRQWPESVLLHTDRDRPCTFCKRMIPQDDYDLHYVMCLTRPRVTYNEDILQVDKGECSICLEDMNAGELIARLPCLCIYHKRCIVNWFQRKQTCPEHPGD